MFFVLDPSRKSERARAYMHLLCHWMINVPRVMSDRMEHSKRKRVQGASSDGDGSAVRDGQASWSGGGLAPPIHGNRSREMGD